MLIQVFLSIDLRRRDSEVLLGRLLADGARAAHDRFGLTYTGIVRAGFTISNLIANPFGQRICHSLIEQKCRNAFALSNK